MLKGGLDMDKKTKYSFKMNSLEKMKPLATPMEKTKKEFERVEDEFTRNPDIC
jgi:phage-related tail protein